MDNVSKTVNDRCRALAVLGASDVGWKTEHLRKAFIANRKSILDYSAPGWQPYRSATQLDRLDRAQNKALRRVTGQVCSTPVEAVRLEANGPSYHTISRRLTAVSWEKAKRAPVNHRGKSCQQTRPLHRLTRSNWREQARRIGDQLPAELEIRKGTRQAQPPWKERRNNWEAHAQLEGENRTMKGAEKALKLLTDHEAGVVIYTDGSAAAGTSKNGAGFVVTIGDPENPTVVTEMKIKGRELTSSKTTIQWVPSHVDIPGNEMADTLANEATISEDPPKSVSLAAARACIKRTIKESAPSHPRVYSKLSRRKNQEAIKTRKDAITLARLRSGHHAAFGAYRNLMDPSVDPMCRRCEDVRDTV